MGSAACFFTGHFTRAATIARKSQQGAHPYIVPKLASAFALAGTSRFSARLFIQESTRDRIARRRLDRGFGQVPAERSGFLVGGIRVWTKMASRPAG